ncbi:unnamed protein product [Chrysoparadoxa australica]
MTRGLGNDVPPYLRYEGPVKCWNISRSALSKVVRDIFVLKTAIESGEDTPLCDTAKDNLEDQLEVNHVLPLSLVFHCYLEHNCASHAEVAEWAYNVLQAADEYRHVDVGLHQFALIMKELLPQDYHVQEELIFESLVAQMEKSDEVASGGVPTGLVSVEAFKAVIQSEMTYLGRASYNYILNALRSETNRAMNVYYKELLSLEDDRISKTANAIRLQLLTETRNFVKTIQACISSVEESKGENGELPLSALRGAMITADPFQERPAVNEILARGAKCAVEELLALETQGIKFNAKEFAARVTWTMVKAGARGDARHRGNGG